MQQATVGLVERDPFGQFLEFFRSGLAQVPFDAEVTEDGCGGPEVEFVGASGRVGGPGRDVGAQQFRREELLGPAHHLLAFMGVDAVRHPHPVGALQDAEVDPGAAGGAGLDLQIRVGCPELVHQPVDGVGLGVHARASGGGRAGVDQVAVVVPLDVADVVLGKHREHGVADVVVAVGQAEVDDLLVA